MNPAAPNNGQDNNFENAQTDNTASTAGVTDSPDPTTTDYNASPQAQSAPKQELGDTTPANPPNTNQTPQQAASTPQPEASFTQEPAPNMTQTYTAQPQSPQEAITTISKKSKKPLFFFVFLFLIILILTSLGGLTYAVAYEKIKLEKYPDLQKKVSYFVMDLSFMPKTPKFLLAQTALAHQDVTKQSFDISVAVDSADLASSLGLSNMDIQAKGALDYSDPTNVFGNLDLSFTKDFNFELKKKDKMLYFRLNKLPSFLFAFLGISSSNFDPLLGKWVSYDTTPLDTEARKTIHEDREVDPLSEEFIDENFQKYLDDEILSKMKLSSDTEEGHAVHKITLDADAELIDYVGKKIEESTRQKSNYVYPQSDTGELSKLSDFVKNLKWEVYIDQETYYTRKAILSVDLEYDSSSGLGAFSMGTLMNPLPSNNSAKVALAAKFGNFGEEVIVEGPSESMTFEEFTSLISTVMNEMYGGLINPAGTMGRSKDAVRKADLHSLRNALEIYHSDFEKYPTNLKDLVGTYFSEVPADPDGSNYFYQVTSNGNSYDLCAKLETPPTTNNLCPNPIFNYHISPTSLDY